MEIAQRSTHQPNVSLVAALSGTVLIALFLLAYFFVDFDGGSLAIRHHPQHATPQHILPTPESTLV